VRDLLLVFLKEPRPGQTKTRLVPPLSPEIAAQLYRLLAEEEVRQTMPVAGEYDRLFCYTPPEAEGAIARWFPGETLWPQPGGDLGARMAAAFGEGFARRARRVAIIGTDVPWVSRDIVLDAFRRLDDHDVCLGPARDGGYYLLSLGTPRPALFEGITWSTPSVLAATLGKAEGLGLRVSRLETLTDLDTLGDLEREWPRLKPLLAPAPGLARAVAQALGQVDV
jgi:rSAM/selenodomain-associated transferase 1